MRSKPILERFFWNHDVAYMYISPPNGCACNKMNFVKGKVLILLFLIIPPDLINKFLYYIDTSVLLENIPLVTFIKVHPGPEWLIFHNLTREFIDDVILVISLYYFSDVFCLHKIHIFAPSCNILYLI